jgi:ArsR family transcriptional regulator
MPDLIESSSPLNIAYLVSLPHSLLSTISLVCAAPQFEGLGDWLQETRLRLPPDLHAELCLLVNFPGSYHRFTAELITHLPNSISDMGFDELMTHLAAISGADYQGIALKALARGATPPPQPADLIELLDRPDAWAAYLLSVESEANPAAVALLVRDGEGLRHRLLTALSRFWQEIYAEEFQATRPLMERSVAHHRAQSYSPNFLDLFTTVTGRLAPEGVRRLLPEVSTVTFIPSCYVGPYVAYTRTEDNLILYYNCRATPTSPAVIDGASLYPPLKALADETRLQILALLRGQELYAQEIVDQLDISQPAVSRHLNLMAAADVLSIRREGAAKYYSINGETLATLADALRTFV